MMEDEIRNKDYLDEILKTDPEYSLPEDFAEKVVLRAQKKTEANRFFREFLIYLGIVFILLAVLSGTGYFLNLDSFERFTEIFPENISWTAGIIVIGLVTLFIDKVILPYFLMFRSPEK